MQERPTPRPVPAGALPRAAGAAALPGILARWRAALAAPRFRAEALLTALALVLGLTLLTRFLAWVEQRPGAVLADPILALYRGRDVAWPVFCIIYGGVLSALRILLRRPERLLLTLQAYVVMIGMRALLMYVTPLVPPEDQVTLRDPLVNAFVPGQDLTHDLFFSGHTSTLVLLSLAVGAGRARKLLILAAILVGALMLVQKAHYAVDVLVAPLAAWSAYSIVTGVRAALEARPRSARSTRL